MLAQRWCRAAAHTVAQRGSLQCLRACRRQYSMTEIGKFNRPVPGVAFPPGQFFIHSVLGYRGVVLQPLRISVTNLPLAPADDSVGPRGVAHDASVPRRDHFLYLVLPDVNDYPQAARGSHFYVSADHLMAFTPTEAVPVANPKFRQFFIRTPFTSDSTLCYRPTAPLSRFIAQHQTLFYIPTMYRYETEAVSATVIPAYIRDRLFRVPNMDASFVWQCTYLVHNKSGDDVRLDQSVFRSRDAGGHMREVSADHNSHVIKRGGGLEKVIDVTLNSPMCVMSATYTMARLQPFKYHEVTIPPHTLNPL